VSFELGAESIFSGKMLILKEILNKHFYELELRNGEVQTNSWFKADSSRLSLPP
jgi:hypothetical protein